MYFNLMISILFHLENIRFVHLIHLLHTVSLKLSAKDWLRQNTFWFRPSAAPTPCMAMAMRSNGNAIATENQCHSHAHDAAIDIHKSQNHN